MAEAAGLQAAEVEEEKTQEEGLVDEVAAASAEDDQVTGEVEALVAEGQMTLETVDSPQTTLKNIKKEKRKG